MADLTVQLVLKSKDTPVWINNACCGCQLHYSVKDAEELIAQLEFAIDKVAYENNRARNEAMLKAWNALPASERVRRMQTASEMSKKLVDNFYAQDPIGKALRKEETNENHS